MRQTDEQDRRELSGPAVLSEPQPLGELVLTVLSYLPVIIPFAILMAAGAFYLTTPTQPKTVASSEIGLTGKVVWPFFDSARLRTVNAFQDAEFQTALSEQLGDISYEELAIDMPENQTYLVITASSDSAENAAVAVNTAAEMVLIRDLERQSADAIAQLNQVEAVLASSNARAAELRADLDSFLIREAEARAALAARPLSLEAREEVLAIDIEQTGLDQALAEELRRQVQLQFDRDQAQAEVNSIAPDLELLRLSTATDEPVARSLVPVIAAFIAAMAAALGAALVWDRARGRLKSRWQSEQLAGVPVLAEIRSGDRWRPSIDLFLASLADVAVEEENIVAIVGLRGAQTRRWLKMIVHYFEVSNLRVIALAHSSEESTPLGAGDEIKWSIVEDTTDLAETLHGVSSIILPSDLTVLDSALMRPTVHEIAEHCDVLLLDGATIDDDVSEQAMALADLSVLFAGRKLNRVDQLRKAARKLESRRSRFLGVVITTPRPPKAKYKRVDDETTIGLLVSSDPSHE